MEEAERLQSPTPPQLPKTWREHIFHSLPYYSGPYAVGYMEIELPVDEPRTFSAIKREHQHALRLDTVLFSVYYPHNFDATEDPKAKSRVPWLPRPRVPTCKGYAKFFNIPHFPVTAYISATTMFTKLPAFRNAKLATSWPGGPRGRAQQEELAKGELKYPVIIFSHGLGGSRTMYSTVCGELASYGFVVIAMEHRDGSGARTYVNVPEGNDSPNLDRRRSGVRSDAKERGQHEKRYYVVDYIFPKDNAQDTSPHNKRGVDMELRGAQIEMRLAEMGEAFKALKLINQGRGEEVAARNLRRKGNAGSSSRGLEGINWDDWKGKMYLENVTAMGHSFGGATTVQILRLNREFPWVGQGILLDAWGPATPIVPEGSKQRITKPLLSIGSEAFMHWEENYDKISEICHEARDGGKLAWMLTIKGSTHLSQTDFAILYPNWMSWFMKTLVNQKRAMSLTITSALEFLKIVLPPQQTKFETSWWVSEGLLKEAASQPDESVLNEHKPDEKWTAARLKINNEMQLRFAGWVRSFRTPTGNVPKDASGKPLVGLKVWETGDEIWMHMSPDQADVQRHLDRSEWMAYERPVYNQRCQTM